MGCNCGGSRRVSSATRTAGSVPINQSLVTEVRSIKVYNDGRLKPETILRTLDTISVRERAGSFNGAELIGETVFTKEQLNEELNSRGVEFTF